MRKASSGPAATQSSFDLPRQSHSFSQCSAWKTLDPQKVPLKQCRQRNMKLNRQHPQHPQSACAIRAGEFGLSVRVLCLPQALPVFGKTGVRIVSRRALFLRSAVLQHDMGPKAMTKVVITVGGPVCFCQNDSPAPSLASWSHHEAAQVPVKMRVACQA